MAVLVALLLGGAAIGTASAQAPYPNRPIRVVVPFGPGGFADITMRLVGQKLSERTGQQVVIENRPERRRHRRGQRGDSAQPDGYTLFVFSSGIALSKRCSRPCRSIRRPRSRRSRRWRCSTCCCW